MSESRPRRPARLGRILVGAVVAILVVWLLFEFVFPWVESRWYNPAVGVVTWWTCARPGSRDA